jgi:hypothetical protein
VKTIKLGKQLVAFGLSLLAKLTKGKTKSKAAKIANKASQEAKKKQNS